MVTNNNSGPSIRNLMDLCESLSEAKSKPLPPHLQRQAEKEAPTDTGNAGLAIKVSNQFMPSLKEMMRTFGDLELKLIDFIKVKMQDPINGRYGKHDKSFTAPPLNGLNHCHLRDDAILIYTMKGGSLNLMYVCPHKDIEGRAQFKTRTLIDKSALQNVDPKAFIAALLK